ncbi:MAG TPA: arginase [Burkholderiales bacterium]|nr:arginase [Burkholderiales bacterium]
MERHIEVIGAAWGLGGADPGCADAPDVLAPRLLRRLQECGVAASAGPIVRAPAPGRNKAATVGRLCGELASAVAAALRGGRLPCVLGGDHSCAGGTWSGVARALHGRLGLVWIDAHMDSHTPRTSHTGRLHGMPLAWLLGEDDDPLYGLSAGVLDPRHVALVGVRSFEPEEDERLRRLGVRVFMMEEVRRRGIEACTAEALAIAARGTDAIGVSIDLDVVTPEEAPGVGTPVASGVGAAELARALVRIADCGHLAAIELVEYSPALDADGASAAVALDLLAAALCGRARENAQVLADPVERDDA